MEFMAAAIQSDQSWDSISSSVGAARYFLCAGFPVTELNRAAVGTPTAITGIPTVRRESSFREAAAPEPGIMPAVESCTVRHRREGSLQHRESTARTQVA